MNKQTIGLATITSALAITLGATPASAVEVDEIDCVANPTAEACLVTTSDEDAADAISEPVDCKEGVVAEDCVTVNPIAVEETTEEEEGEASEEPALWPMYLSLGTLGLAILVFIILNLFGGKKKK